MVCKIGNDQRPSDDPEPVCRRRSGCHPGRKQDRQQSDVTMMHPDPESERANRRGGVTGGLQSKPETGSDREELHRSREEKNWNDGGFHLLQEQIYHMVARLTMLDLIASVRQNSDIGPGVFPFQLNQGARDEVSESGALQV